MYEADALTVSIVNIVSGVVGGIIGLFILYYLIRSAVKNGIVMAFKQLPAINVITEAEAVAEGDIAGSAKKAPGETWSCPKCGVANSGDRSVCRKCNRPWATQIKAGAVDKKYCPNCGTARVDDLKTSCVKCGYEFAKGAADKKYCPNCGAKRPTFGGVLDDVKCAHCGHAF